MQRHIRVESSSISQQASAVRRGDARRPGARIVSTGLFAVLLSLTALPAAATSFLVQCPTSTITHPDPGHTGVNNSESAYTGPTTLTPGPDGYLVPTAKVNGAIKCQQISGGDGFATMGDGTQTYLFGFGPLSGLKDMAEGKPGTEFPDVFNTEYSGSTPLAPGDPATTGLATFTYNGAVGLTPDPEIAEHPLCTASPAPPAGRPSYCSMSNPDYALDGYVDPRPIMDVGTMNANMPAPLMAVDEDDEFFLTLTNVGQIMRPDLFEQHTVHWHGYPNASGFYDGVPDASVAINVAASFTYYYLAPDAGTYFWHCHVTPPEHLQMGMVGQIYVRPRQNRVPVGGDLYDSLVAQQADPRTRCNRDHPATSEVANDILCTNPLPAVDTGATRAATGKYAYNDGDGSTYYDKEYAIQIHGFDPSFHFLGLTFNPEGFTDMKDKYFLLNGRSYPDTVEPDPNYMKTDSADGVDHFSQPLPSLIELVQGQKALLRLSSLDVTEYQTLASAGIPMQVIAINAKLLRDQAGNNLYYKTNSITLGGGESLDVILDSTGIPPGTYYLYTPQLDHLSNDAENFGGLMTEVHVTGS